MLLHCVCCHRVQVGARSVLLEGSLMCCIVRGVGVCGGGGWARGGGGTAGAVLFGGRNGCMAQHLHSFTSSNMCYPVLPAVQVGARSVLLEGSLMEKHSVLQPGSVLPPTRRIPSGKFNFGHTQGVCVYPCV